MPSWSPIFNGEFDDFTTEWYKQIGVSIILTMLLGIFSPHLANGMFWLKGSCKRLYDRRCTRNRRKTRQIFQGDYEQMYLGPELLFEYRYSTMLNTVFISLMFGTGMPILYLFGFIAFWITYWVDKWTMLRIYQIPPNYNKEVVKSSREWINAAIILHFLFGWWMYSNAIIFETQQDKIFGIDVSTETEDIDDNYPWLNIHERISQYHSLIYFASFIVFILIFLSKAVLFKMYRKCKNSCQKNKKLEMIKEISQHSSTFSTNYFKGLDRSEFKCASAHLQEDIKKYKIMINYSQLHKSFKQSIDAQGEHEQFTQEDKNHIEWFIERLKLKRENIESAYKARRTRSALMSDFSYNIRDLKPYKYYISRMEQDIQEHHRQQKNQSDQNDEDRQDDEDSQNDEDEEEEEEKDNNQA